MQDDTASLQQGAEQRSELPTIDIVRCKKKWYLRNTRRLRCSKETNVEAVEVCMSAEHLSRMGGTSSQLSDRRQKSNGCFRRGGTDQLHLGVERERHSGWFRINGTEIQAKRYVAAAVICCSEMAL